MRGKLLLSIVYVLGGASAALAQDVITNVSTGIDGSGNLLADSQADDRYTLFVNADNRGAPVAIPAGFPIPPWLANSDTSRWIGLDAPSANGPPGFYEFDITVTLTADQAERAVLTGSWSTDNAGVDILINFDDSTGATTDGNFGQLHPFPPNLGLGLFQEGENTITFVLENAGDTENPAGLRVDGAVVVIRNVLISPLQVAVTVGDPDVTMQVQIPVGSNDTQAVTVTVITSEPAVAVPVGAAADRIVLTFPAGGPLAQTFDLQLGRSGTATIVLENDVGLDNTQAEVLVQPRAIPIFNLSTGISEGGALLDQAVEDPRYVITEFVSIPDGFTFDTPATPVTVPDGFPIPPWVANTDTSRWIGPNAGAANGPPGEFFFTIEVEIPDVFDAASAILVGSWATDNSGAVLVNGTPAEVTGGGFGGLAALPDQAGAGLFQYRYQYGDVCRNQRPRGSSVRQPGRSSR